MAAVTQWLFDILTFPVVIYDELRQEEYLSLLVAGVSAYYIFGLPQEFDTPAQLAVAYLGTGAIVVGTRILMDQQ